MKERAIRQKLYRGYGGIGRGSLFFIYRWTVFPHLLVESYIPREGLVYDIGCGYGIFSNMLALTSDKRNVVGIDFSSHRLSNATRVGRNLRLPNVNFFQDNVFKLKLEECSAVVIIDVLHHISSWEKQKLLLDEVIPYVKPSGKVIIVDILPLVSWKYLLAVFVDNVMYMGSKISYPKQDKLINLLERHGCSVETHHIYRQMPYANILYVAEKL